MLSPDTSGWLKRGKSLVAKDLRSLVAGQAFWIMLLILCPLVGYGFIQAVYLFAEASQAALKHPEMAPGMIPLDGVLVPTLGAFYLAMTLLFPFVALRLVGAEKQSGGLKLLLQTPFSVSAIVASKFCAAAFAWLVTLAPVLSALAIWAILGGHLHGPELANLLLGHFLYAMVIGAIAFFAAAVSETSATAAILALSFTIGSWVLDFAGAQKIGWWQHLSEFSLSAVLRSFEQGLFSWSRLIHLTGLCLGFLVLTGLWLHPGRPVRQKFQTGAVIVFLTMGFLTLAHIPRFSFDVSEDRRHSFSAAVDQGLKEMQLPLKITVCLAGSDPRLMDLERSILAKLHRLFPDLTITIGTSALSGKFHQTSEETYGLVEYDYGGKKQESRSTSPEEILPLLFELAGKQMPKEDGTPYPGYPLVADAAMAGYWFYVVLPVLMASVWGWVRYKK